jgi:hypothetical protein
MNTEPSSDRGTARRQVLRTLAFTLPVACVAAAGAASTPAVAGPAVRVGSGLAGQGGPVPFRPGRAMLGSYTSLRGQSLTQSLALRRRQLGRGQRIVHKFYPWNGYLPTDDPDLPADSVLMMSWHGAPYRAVNNGSSDRMIASVATKLAGMRRPVMLRWGWEMNRRGSCSQASVPRTAGEGQS